MNLKNRTYNQTEDNREFLAAQKAISGKVEEKQLKKDNTVFSGGNGAGNLNDASRQINSEYQRRKMGAEIYRTNTDNTLKKGEIAAEAGHSKQENGRYVEGKKQVKSVVPSKGEIARRVQNRKDLMMNSLKARLSREENRNSLDAMVITIIFFAFLTAVIGDLLDLFLDSAILGFFLAPITSAITGFVVGFLWWSLGVDSTNNKLKKGGKRLGWSCVIEATPLNFIPTFTILCLLNLADYLGYRDGNSLASVVKNRASGSISGA